MKIKEYDVNLANTFKLLGQGLLGLLFLTILIGVWSWTFFLWFGKIFMQFGKAYGEHIDKKMKDVDKANRTGGKEVKR